MCALLKSTARMPESILVDNIDKTKPSHYDNPLHSLKCASYAFKWMDEVNDHYFGEPSHLTKYMRVNMKPFIVNIHTHIGKLDNMCWLC